LGWAEVKQQPTQSGDRNFYVLTEEGKRVVEELKKREYKG
jgi:DNA-binding PadR family transcriptional regulator